MSGSRSSPHSVASHASSVYSKKSTLSNSHRSLASHRSSSSRKSTLTNSSRSLSSTNSHKTSSSNTNRENETLSLQQKGQKRLESNRYADAIKYFTLALRTCDNDTTAKRSNRTIDSLYRYRCEALYEIGLFDLAVKDARNALKVEQSSAITRRTENGLVLRGQSLLLLGFSLLKMGGKLESAKKAFEDSIEVTEEAIDNLNFLSNNDQQATSPHFSKELLLSTIKDSKNGLTDIETFQALEGSLVDSSRKGYIIDLDSMLEISPGNIDLHTQKLKYLINRNRWFEVANHCEQIAAKASRYCRAEIFRGDLKNANPLTVVELESLDCDYFTRNDIATPRHLRMLPTAATHEAVSLLPKEFLPYYFTALRLEDRFDSALVACNSLRKTGESMETEKQKMIEMIKLRKEGNFLFRNGEFDQAASLFKQCLEVFSDTKSGGQLNAILYYNRGSCFYAMGQYQEAIAEFTHAISIHSMYTNAILHRARCYLKTGDRTKASANFNRYLTLVFGAKEHPYPPLYKGSNCYFDIPSEVTYRQVELVRAEMNVYNIVETNSGNTQPASLSLTQKLNRMIINFCCKNGVTDQVIIDTQSQARQDQRLRISNSNLTSSSTSGTKLVRCHGDPPSHATSIRSNSNFPTIMENEFDTKDRVDP